MILYVCRKWLLNFHRSWYFRATCHVLLPMFRFKAIWDLTLEIMVPEIPWFHVIFHSLVHVSQLFEKKVNRVRLGDSG